MRFNTKILHTPYPKQDAYNSLRMPVYDTAAFDFPESEEIAMAFDGRKPAHVYSRSTNPTIEYYESLIKSISGAFHVISLASGMAAIQNVLFNVTSAGDNILTSKHLFGNTISLFEKTCKQFAIEFRYVDMNKPIEFKEKIDVKTRAIFLETVTNPQLEIADIESIANICKQRNILLVVDTTLTPPCVFEAGKWGVNIEICSSTKFFSGGATSVGGLIIDYGNFDWKVIPALEDYVKFDKMAFSARLRKEVYRNLGACTSPHNAWLQILGLETLDLRFKKAAGNCKQLAESLQSNPKILHVNYPGLENSKYYANSQKFFGNLPVSIFTIELESIPVCFQFLDQLKIIRRATNMCDNKTLAIHPYSTIFAEFSDEQKNSLDVNPHIIRISVGIEDIEDLFEDIEQSLNKI